LEWLIKTSINVGHDSLVEINSAAPEYEAEVTPANSVEQRV
jgi:hypothetical protein